MNANELKRVVKEKYSKIANQSKNEIESSCCGATNCCSTVDDLVFRENYENIKGYNPDADLGLGCGIPTQYASIKEGDHVLDLGSGAGNDCFVVCAIVGKTGRVTGLDFTDAMLIKAMDNAKKLGFENVEFIKGDIEEMPLADNLFDVVISNCVLNLVPDKNKAFSEIRRVLKPDGHFCVSDVVIEGDLPEKLRKDAEMYAGCVSGAIDIEEYLTIIEKQGFNNIRVHKKKTIELPAQVLSEYFTAEEMAGFQHEERGIFSITVSGSKKLILKPFNK
jgi:SAM-dependent methyltransferase